MEVVLGIAIINKLAGLYGILSLITGHPIDPLQWVFYLSSIIVIPFYANGLVSVRHPSLPKYALISVIFLLDTVFGVLFVLWFAFQWFSTPVSESLVSQAAVTLIETAPIAIATTTTSSSSIKPLTTQTYELEAPFEDNEDILIRRALQAAAILAARDVASQGASYTYELMVTIVTTIFVTVARIYFTLVILSFTRLLLKSKKYGIDSDNFNDRNNDHLIEGSTSKPKKWLYSLENKAVDVIMLLFKE